MKRSAAPDRRTSFPLYRPSTPVGRPSLAPARASSPPPAALLPHRRHVDASDLARIDLLQALLLTLNDPRASAVSIARHVQGLEVLAARIEERFLQRQGGFPPRLTEQIALLGNRQLEEILLGLLEDVVTLHSEILDESSRGGAT